MGPLTKLLVLPPVTVALSTRVSKFAAVVVMIPLVNVRLYGNESGLFKKQKSYSS